MPQTSFALMTTLGRSKEAAALANATTIDITQIAIGDGATVPSGGETALYNEVGRFPISSHGVVVGASNVAYFDAFLAAEDGPYTIREAGLYDADGDLIAIAHYNPAINKPIPASGQTVEGTVRLEVAFSNVANITISVDPSMQVALQRLSRLPWIPVISMTTATPPASPTVGDCYLIPASPTGEWAGQAGKIAERTVAGWAIISPADGHGISLPDGRIFERIAGAYTEKIANDVQSGKWSYAAAGGAANALTCTLSPSPIAYADGMVIHLYTPDNLRNTGNCTLNVNGLGAVGITQSQGADLDANDVAGHQRLIYRNNLFWLESVRPATTGMKGLVNRATDADARSRIGTGVVSAAQLTQSIAAVAFGSSTRVRYDTPGTHAFVVPANVYSIEVELWGGGGGGGYNTVTSGAPSGGASGGYARKKYNVTPGQSVTCVVGAGGIGGSASPAQAGQPGTASSVTAAGVTVTATGGGGGKNATLSGVSADAPTGGNHSGADFGLRGEDGHIGYVAGANYYGGSGAAAPLGGGQCAGGAGTPAAGQFPGGGGGGTGDALIAGATGAHGSVIIQYVS